jgi:hypothetical protein
MNNSEETKEASTPLLDEATTARLKAPILQSEERAREAVERREQKSTDAKQLKDALRLEELRAIPKLRRTVEEQREFSRLDQRQRRVKERSGLTKGVLSQIETAEDFYALNRATVSTRKISEWKLLHEQVSDQLSYMEHGNKINGVEIPETDPDWISPEDGEECLDDFVKVHGVVRLGYIYKSDSLRGGDWSTQYWKNSEILLALTQENEPTKIYTLCGLLTGVPDWKYEEWKRAHGKKPLVDIGKWVDGTRVRYR